MAELDRGTGRAMMLATTTRVRISCQDTHGSAPADASWDHQCGYHGDQSWMPLPLAESRTVILLWHYLVT